MASHSSRVASALSSRRGGGGAPFDAATTQDRRDRRPAALLHHGRVEVLMRIKSLTAALVVVSAFIAWSPSVRAKATWVKKAQAEDASVKSCVDCHTSMKSKELNARGRFLMDKKKELKAADVDFKWLKDYKPSAADADKN
jgi:hypothetical protein